MKEFQVERIEGAENPADLMPKQLKQDGNRETLQENVNARGYFGNNRNYLIVNLEKVLVGD